MEWDDLVLHPNTLCHIREIENWITTTIPVAGLGMHKKLKSGYRALFYGPRAQAKR